ncbi:MAG: YbaB/EbfC family nucleoid-associated protein [Balneolales bacterium]|nr:YbaB/EbfC family nucleoid-associated protein [Balneolales bacterium]
MADMFGKVQEMQKKMEEAKQSLGELEISAEVGGGMVKVVANGNREVRSIKIDKDVIDPNDSEMLEDLIVAGVNKALTEADRAGKEKMAEITRGMMPGGGIPGMDLSKFGL